MAETFNAIATSIKDLIKFKAVSYVNTGDKTQDNLINAVLLTILTALYTYLTYEKMTKFWGNLKCSRKRKNKTVVGDSIVRENLEYYDQYFREKDVKFTYFSCASRDKDAVDKFMSALLNDWFKIYYVSNTDNPLEYDPKHKILKNSKEFDVKRVVTSYIREGTPYPLYKEDDAFVILIRYNREFMVGYTDKDVLYKYLEMIENYSHTTDVSAKISKSIMTIKKESIGTIYPDRDLDMFVSRHKQTIINALKSFMAAQEDKSEFGGYGTYNLGIMLHGLPGTGKTFLMKAIANHLRRDVVTVDMRMIKSKSQFEAIFTNYGDVIYCLDEFDCVQGVTCQRNENSTTQESPHKGELADLRARQVELLKIIASATPAAKGKDGEDLPGNNSKSLIERELGNVEKRIADLENALTLDTILTTLDGIREMRGRVIIATTNFLSKIDSALMRAGRFDLKINLGNFNDDEVRELLLHMFANSSEADLDLIRNTKYKNEVYAPVDIIHIATSRRNLTAVVEELAEKEKKE